MKRACILLCAITASVRGHGLLTKPASKNGGNLSTPLTSSTAHFAMASYGIIDKAFFDGDHGKTPWTKPGVFDFEMARDLLPGYPETLHPCGCNAGNIEHCAGVTVASGFGETTQGGTVTPPEWMAGSYQETAWNAWVNHGGGYVYMLCKKTDFDSCRDTILPENPAQATQSQKDAYLRCVWECFESKTLEWVPEPQKLQFQDDVCTYAAMKPLEKIGKNDHKWRFMIPDALQVTNGGEGVCMWDSVTGFSNDKAEDEFTSSFGEASVCDWGRDAHAPHDWHVKDRVKIPLGLEEGEYLLSWRWDAYKADQMWTNCADVKIIAASTAVFSPVSKEAKCTSMPTPPPAEREPTPMPAPVASPPSVPQPLVCPSAYTGLRPHDFCTKYFNCVNGVVRGVLTDCPQATLFDVNVQYCNWDYLVTCEGPTPTNPPINPPTNPSTKTPTRTEGCYSNNYKDCNHPDFQSEDNSCSTIWLPNGSRNSCTALWGKCNDKNGNCCEPAVCHGDNFHAQCIAPPTPSPTQACIDCKDKENKSMVNSEKDCATSKKYIKKKCSKNKQWRKKKYCQLSCFNIGLGYTGDVCCNGKS